MKDHSPSVPKRELRMNLLLRVGLRVLCSMSDREVKNLITRTFLIQNLCIIKFIYRYVHSC